MVALKVLIGSPVRQDPDILDCFLQGLRALEIPSDTNLSYCFVDDNDQPESRRLLESFEQQQPNTVIFRIPVADAGAYRAVNGTHQWTDALVWKVAAMKNLILSHALKENHDAVFLVDSDLILHPKTLVQLVSSDREIVSEVFWTSWVPGQPELPNVWVADQYRLFEQARGEVLTQEQAQLRMQAFLAKLRQPGLYEVGGLGACTLIRRTAMLAGVNFNEIPNLPWWGEDRHFCIRAAAIGLKLWADTHYPAFHVYRPEQLPEARRRLREVAAGSGRCPSGGFPR